MTVPASQIMERSTDVVEWSLHLARVGLWVLLSAWCLITAVRLAALASLRLQPRAVGVGPERPLLVAVVAASAALGTGAMAFRPDERFLVNRGGQAAEDRDCAAVVRYLEPVARWNSKRPEVYENLGLCYLEARRFRDAIAAFHRARTLALTPESFAFCALAHLALGEREQARQDLAAALPLARSAEQKSAIAARLEALPASVPGASTR